MIHVHFCFLDRECRDVGAGNRVNLTLGKHYFYFNLTDWSDRGHYRV